MIGNNPQISISDLTTHPTNRRQGNWPLRTWSELSKVGPSG